MLRLTTVCAAAALAMTAGAAGAQVKTIPVKTEFVTASVEAIDHASRKVTVKKPDGTHEELYVPLEIKRFDSLKVGDKVTTKYYENIVVRLQAPGAKDVDETSRAVTRAEKTVAGTMAHQRTITATIVAIDPAVPSITFTGPKNWKYSSRVKDTAVLAQFKVGDKVDITWTEAMLLSLDPAK